MGEGAGLNLRQRDPAALHHRRQPLGGVGDERAGVKSDEAEQVEFHLSQQQRLHERVLCRVVETARRTVPDGRLGIAHIGGRRGFHVVHEVIGEPDGVGLGEPAARTEFVVEGRPASLRRRLPHR